MFEDVKAIYRNDPACKNIEFLLYPCLHAIVAHRYLIHPLYRLGCALLPRMLQIMRFSTGMEIHPGASIGRGFFCDRGSGVVIGETVEIGENCVMFHGVTLGGTGKHVGKRHPSVGNEVFLGTHATTILGPVVIGDRARVGAEAVVINRDVPENCVVVGAPAVIVKRDGKKVHEPLPVSQYHIDDRTAE